MITEPSATRVPTLLDAFVAHRPRRAFDATQKDDVLELAYFKKYSRWKTGCPFILERPYQDIASMCSDKFMEHTLPKV